MIAVDTETEGLEYEAVIVGVCLSTRPNTGYYIPVRHEMYDGVPYENQLPPAQVFDAIRPALETRPCVGHNTKFDKQALWKDGVDCNFTDDTLAITKLFGDSKQNGLKFCVKKEFGHEMAELDSLFKGTGNKKPQIRPAVLSPEAICNYAVEDANWTLQLFLKYSQMIPNLKTNRLYQLEMKLLPVVAEMEAFGIPVSKTFLQEQGAVCAAHEKRLEQEIVKDVRELLGDPEYTCNFGSPKQLAELLYEHLKLPIQISPKSGNRSTDKDALAVLAVQNPVASRIQTLRTMGKLNGTYLTGLLDKVHPDGRIRGGFNQFGTDTGRFSSSKPNLQNLPRTQTFFLWPADDQSLAEEFLDPEHFRRTPEGTYEFYDSSKGSWIKKADEIVAYEQDGKIKTKMGVASDGRTYGIEDGVFKEVWRCPTRDFVAASPGHYLIEADYSQIELRIMAGESGEPTLVNAYANGDDVHTATTATIHGIRPEDVTDNQRQGGKTLNFSLLYGAGADGTSKLLGISKAEAQDLIDKYFANMTCVGDWMESVKAAARQCGYATTNFGRVRRFPMIKPPNEKWIRAKQEREAVNFKIQGAAADVMKLALVRTSARLRAYFGDDAKIVSTVHDSVVLEVADHIAIEDLMAVLKDGMATGINKADFTRSWPDLVVDVKKGPSWAAAKGVDWPEEDHPLPPRYEGELPRVRVRKVALEREYGISSSPTANKTEQVDIFTGLVTTRTEQEEETARQDTSWVIELPKPPSPAQFTGLTEFLSARSDKVKKSKLYGTVKVVMPGPDDSAVEHEINGRFALSLEDHTALRIKIGNCTLRQELDDIDPDEVMRGIDFGL